MRFILIAFCLALSLPTLAQTGQHTKFLVVDRYHGPKRYRYVPNKMIHLKNKSGIHVEGPISQILDSSIVIGNQKVLLSDIQTVYLDDKARGAALASEVLIKAGLGYFAISAFNRTINDDAPIIHESVYYFSVPAVGIGYMIKFLVKPKVKIKDQGQIKILDLSIGN